MLAATSAGLLTIAILLLNDDGEQWESCQYNSKGWCGHRRDEVGLARCGPSFSMWPLQAKEIEIHNPITFGIYFMRRCFFIPNQIAFVIQNDQ
jgi:hypothetical protein